jgi:hypothetical protein
MKLLRWLIASGSLVTLILYRPAASGRFDPTGKSGSYVGDLMTLTVNFHLSNHQDIFIGYSHLYAGDFIHNAPTASAPLKGSTSASRATDPELFYVQYSFKW